MSETTSIRNIDETARQRFEATNCDRLREPLDKFLPPREDSRYLATLEELVLIELELAWKTWDQQTVAQGQADPPVSTESYIARFPELNTPAIVRRIAEQEFLVRHAFGDRPSAQEFQRRFPQIIDQPQRLEDLLAGRKQSQRQKRFGQRYTEARLHAQGGLGRIWLVRDRDIGRRVALKQMRGGLAGDELETRFLLEAQITGQLEHPNIVPVYELSQDEEGQRFYTMRYVDGRTLSAAIEVFHAGKARRPTPSLERVNLLNVFVAVCNAVDYAHARGIIHRDLKGDNVVLGDYGEVFVLDWGLAKWKAAMEVSEGTPSPATRAVELPTEPPDELTLEGDVMGTPGYMSPEQAAGQLEGLDHRSDIYSLGAILYHILTGKPPFAGKTPREMLQAVVLERPARPRELARDTPPALEAICMKALANRREDRYASAGELADDVRRFQADEAVTAYREPWHARWARWARRHRTWVRAVLTALVVVSIISISAAVIVNEARKRAETARVAATSAQKREAAERSRAEDNFELARQAVIQMLTRVAEGPLQDVPRMQEVVRQLLEDAVAFYRTFLEQKGEDFLVRRDAARALLLVGNIRLKLGDNQQAQFVYEEAIQLQKELLAEQGEADVELDLSQTHTNLGHVFAALGQQQDAEQAYEQALDLAVGLAERAPEEMKYLDHLATCHLHLGNHLWQQGQSERAESSFTRAVEIQEQVVAGAPQAVAFRNRLARAYGNLGSLLRVMQRHSEAVVPLGKAVQVKRALVQQYPQVAEFRYDLANSLNHLGLYFVDLNQLSEADETLQEAIDLQTGLVRDYPAVPQYAWELGGSLQNLADLKYRRGQSDIAYQTVRQAITYQTAVLRLSPQTPEYRDFFHNHFWSLHYMLRDRGDHAALSEAARELLSIPPNRADQYHSAAIFLATCVELVSRDSGLSDEEQEQLTDRYVQAAVEYLQRAIEAGLENVESLADAPDLAPLRGHSKFLEFLSQIGDE